MYLWIDKVCWMSQEFSSQSQQTCCFGCQLVYALVATLHGILKFIFNRKSDFWHETSDPCDDFWGRTSFLLPPPPGHQKPWWRHCDMAILLVSALTIWQVLSPFWCFLVYLCDAGTIVIRSYPCDPHKFGVMFYCKIHYLFIGEVFVWSCVQYIIRLCLFVRTVVRWTWYWKKRDAFRSQFLAKSVEQ